MMMGSKQGVYRFDHVEFDVSNVRLTVNGELRQLEPKSFRLLQFLIENRGRVVSKEELLAAIWAETFVTDNAITRAITQIRKALADDSRNPRYIETVPTVGYRFLPEIEVVAPDLAVPVRLERKASPRWLPWVAASALAGVAIAAAVAGLLRAPEHLPSHNLESTQLTTSTGLDVGATFSPDGNLVAYSSDRSGRFQIYVRSLEPGGKELMLTSSAGQNLSPSFSPDGRALTFSALDEAGIFRVPALGGSVQRLTRFGAEPVWSPDGKWIVFRSEGVPTLSTTGYYFPATSSLWLMHADGSEPRQITTAKQPGGGQAFPTWNRDSSEIRFASYQDVDCEMWAYRLSSGKFRKLFSSVQQAGFGSAIFRRDDRSMFYISSRLNGDISIWEQQLNPKTLAVVGAPKPVYQPSVGVPRNLALSADGERLAYSAILSDSSLLLTNLKNGLPEGDQPEQLTHEANFRYLHPAWTPDGKQLAFTAYQKSRTPRIFLLPYPEGQPAEINSDPEPQFYSMFDALGQSLFYLTSIKNGTAISLKQFSLPDGISKTVAQLPDNIRQPSLNPDGSEIAFNWKTDDFSHIWKMNLKSGAKQQLTFGDHETGYPRYSHSGQWICYEQVIGNQANLGIMPASGPEPKDIFARGIYYVYAWSPDDTKIAYAGFENGIWNLYWVDRETREKQQLTRNTNARVYFRYPAWSYDGSKIAYEFNESKGNVYLARFR